MGNIVVNTPSSNTNGSRGPQLPITVPKTNREDINDKFCKFEINKINPSKEEQSETGWSLDADASESVINEPINDRLGIDDTSSGVKYVTLRNQTGSSTTVGSSSNNQSNLINFSEPVIA